MMRLISNGEPYIYTHKCLGNEVKGDIMTEETQRLFVISALYDSFCQCGMDVTLVNDDSWNYELAKASKDLHAPGRLKQEPDIVYRMSGEDHETWFYVMLDKNDMGLIDSKFIGRSIDKRGILPVLVVGDIWCFDTNGKANICGGAFAAKFETVSLLRDNNKPLPMLLSQKQLIEKVAQSWQALDADIIEPYLDKDFHYSADAVFYEMSSRFEYLNYLRSKYDKLKDGSNPIGIKIGRMDGTNDFALLLHQGAYNQDLLVTITVCDGRITSMRMCEYIV